MLDSNVSLKEEISYQDLLDGLKQNIQNAQAQLNQIRQNFDGLKQAINEFTGAINTYIGGRHNKARTRVRQRIVVLKGTIKIFDDVKDKKMHFLTKCEKCVKALSDYLEKAQTAQEMGLPAGWTQMKIANIFEEPGKAIRDLYCLQNNIAIAI